MLHMLVQRCHHCPLHKTGLACVRALLGVIGGLRPAAGEGVGVAVAEGLGFSCIVGALPEAAVALLQPLSSAGGGAPAARGRGRCIGVHWRTCTGAGGGWVSMWLVAHLRRPPSITILSNAT